LRFQKIARSKGFEMLGRYKWSRKGKAGPAPVSSAGDRFAIPAAGFDESLYLNHNPDVAAKVAATPGLSGWRYFVEHGWLENRVGVPRSVFEEVRRAKNYEIDQVLPPGFLRKRIHGSEDVETFEQVGRAIASDLLGYLDRAHTPGPAFRVLDFGVGCGRVLTPLQDLALKSSPARETIEWHGSDIDEQAIDWCRTYLGSRATFVVNETMPPLPFPDGFFDFLYSISIFTHLPEAMQFAWLKEINRVLKAGGEAVMSTHSFGPPRKPKEERLIARGFHHGGGKGAEGLPDFYQTSYHTREYIEREWAKYVSVEAFVEKGVNNDQNLVLCRRLG
jgi:ubiquinone/menaquinone biosynthesis C-methylase UbiE